jgi:hypothetical protein
MQLDYLDVVTIHFIDGKVYEIFPLNASLYVSHKATLGKYDSAPVTLPFYQRQRNKLL